MNDRGELEQLLQNIAWFSDHHQELSDESCVAMLRRCGVPGLELVANLMRLQVDARDELLATYCMRLLIRSKLPGRVDLILEAIRLPFEKWVRDEVWEAIYDDAVGHLEFLADRRFVAASEELATSWSNGQLTQFLEKARSIVNRNEVD